MLATTLLAACGGGGGGGGGAPAPDSTYIKASNTALTPAECTPDPGGCDQFGTAVALSADGNTLVVAAAFEDSSGIDQSNNSTYNSGAVYVFVRDAGIWSQQAYIKASNPGALDQFGSALALSRNGNTLAVGVPEEDSNATGIAGNELNNSAKSAGAVYIFVRSGTTWVQQAYIKSDTSLQDEQFGFSVALNGNGNRMAVGAPGKESLYLFDRDLGGSWSQLSSRQAANSTSGDNFGYAVTISDDGSIVAAGAPYEDSNGSSPANETATDAGAVYIFERTGDNVVQTQYLKSAATAPAESRFGEALSISATAEWLAIGAPGEDLSGALGDQGAAYIFTRSDGEYLDSPARIIAENNDPGDEFGASLALAANASSLFVGARLEDSISNPDVNSVDPVAGGFNDANAGAAYEFSRNSSSVWLQTDYIKAFNSGNGDKFGTAIATSSDGATLAIGANLEDGSGSGVNAPVDNVSELQAGAVYVFD